MGRRRKTTFCIDIDWQPQTDEEFRKLMHLWDALTAVTAAAAPGEVLVVLEPQILNAKLGKWMRQNGYSFPDNNGEAVPVGNDAEIFRIR
jgi:hypothetical protein